MRLLHDALRSCPPLLAEPVRADLAPLFARDDLLDRFAIRLLAFARQGVPGSHPPPHFEAECTPPLEEVFAPFRRPLAAWHDSPDAPEVPALLADALAEGGSRTVLVLLGQRLTPASLTDARGFPPSRLILLASATQLHTEGEALTVVARALTKHVHRAPDAFWGDVSGPPEQKNALALAHLHNILDHSTWWNVFGHFQHETVFEARLPSGHGARWGARGETFIGFLEPFDTSRGVAPVRQPS
jgi:hypothetical protein